jgi:hypothetical protein
MNSDNYGVVSRSMPNKMNESMMVPELICRDVRATKRRFNAVNGNSFNTAGTEIRVPIAGNFVLGAHNTNVNFKLQFNDSTGAGTALTSQADFSWHALFSQIRIESGAGSSIILEQIDEPGLVAAFTGMYTYTQSELQKENAKGYGCNRLPLEANGQLVKLGTNISEAQENITLNLSTVLGLFTTSIPLYDTNGITVVFTVNQFGASGVFGADIDELVGIQNLHITCNCLEGGEKYEKDLRDAKTKNGEVSVMFNTVRRYIQSQSAAGGGTTAQLLINDRAKSCLGFFATNRTSANLNNKTKTKNSSSGFDSWQNHHYNIAGQMYPMAGISTEGEAIDEAYDTMQHLSKTKGGGVLSKIQADTTSAYDDTASGTGPAVILAVNLSKCGADEHVWGKGLNLSGSNLSNYLYVQYSPSADSTVNIYSIFQMKVHIDKMGGFSTEF